MQLSLAESEVRNSIKGVNHYGDEVLKVYGEGRDAIRRFCLRLIRTWTSRLQHLFLGNIPESLQEAEEKTKYLLSQGELRSHLALVHRAMNLVGTAIAVSSDRTTGILCESFKVTTLLLVRLTNDLRCLTLIAERGYPLQALTIASSIYEVGITVGYIGDDENFAKKWIEHDDPERPFVNLKHATKDVLKKCGIPDAEVQAETDYRVYRQFCMGKHANPLLQSGHGIIPEGQDFRLRNGPDSSDLAINNLWYALDHALRYVYVALAIFTACHILDEQQSKILEEANLIAKEREELRKVARERWGTQDHFRGKWRSEKDSEGV